MDRKYAVGEALNSPSFFPNIGKLKGLTAECRLLNASLPQLHAHQFGHHNPLFPGIAPDGDGVKVLK